MSKIDYQALREAAEKATKGSYIVGHTSVNQHGNLTGVFVCQKWKGEPGGVIAECHVNCLVETDVQAYANAEFIAAFNPKVALALLDKRERNQQYIKSRDQENEDIALTVGRLRVELEGKDSKIANLTAERDALREGEMGDARHSNTRAAADIYFQLVEECEIPAGGSLVEYVDDMREKLEAAEKRIAGLSKAASVNNHWKPDVCPINGRKFFMWIEHEKLGYVPTYGGPFDSYTIPTRDSSGEFSCERYDHDIGGWVDGEFIGLYLIDDDEQCRVCGLEERIAELEARAVNLPKRSVGEVMHMSGFSQDYAEGWCAGNDNAIHEIRTADIKVKVE